jgi:hypothetical protein
MAASEILEQRPTDRAALAALLHFPLQVVAEARARRFSDAQLLDLQEAWELTHWYAPSSLSEVVEEVLL